MHRGLLTLALLLSAAQARAAEPRTRFSAESDPVDFLNGGYALYLGVKPEALPRLEASNCA